LSAIMIAAAAGANVIAVDITPGKLKLAAEMGAMVTLNSAEHADLEQAIRDVSHGGVHISVDALGSAGTCVNSINSLRKRGKHIQVGLMAGKDMMPAVPMARVIAWELEILGSHGMQAFRYDDMLQMVLSGKLKPEKLVQKTVRLEEGASELIEMDSFRNDGITVINQF